MCSLELIIGPMFSGKTSLLIEKKNLLCSVSENKDKILAINYAKDTRYGESNKIISHDGLSIDCIAINEFTDIYENEIYSQALNSASYIFINEAQFFKNLKTWVLNEVEVSYKNVILCGLDSDFKREKFGEILDLVPHANKVTKLSGKCTKCHNPSIYTHRVTDETDQEVIGVDNYIPVCRACYNILNS